MPGSLEPEPHNAPRDDRPASQGVVAATKEDLEQVRREMRQGFEEVKRRQDRTNGSVGTLWSDVYGAWDRGHPGIKGEIDEVKEVVRDAQAIIRAAKVLVLVVPMLAGLGAFVGLLVLGGSNPL